MSQDLAPPSYYGPPPAAPPSYEETMGQAPPSSVYMSTDPSKLEVHGKPKSGQQDLKKFNNRSKIMKLSLSIFIAFLILVGVIFTAIYCSHKPDEGTELSTSYPEEVHYIGSHQILDKTKWNGMPPLKYRNITSPVSLVIIKHTGGAPCFKFQECIGKLQTIQSQAVSKGVPDIYNNFYIAGDENIYVGRGWDVQSQQWDDIIDIVFIGNYLVDEATPGMIDAALELIEDGVKKSKLTKDYKIVCHNQTALTQSPGKNVCTEVKKWPHYDPGIYTVRTQGPERH